MSTTLTLGFSPCPNDTYIFDALVNQKIDTQGLQFEFLIADVEELNQRAIEGALDITKLSYHAFGHLMNKYQLLNTGSALGRNCGPLLIASETLSAEELKQGRIAIPGYYTTANFLLGLAFPEAKNKVEMLFSDIENAIINKKVDAGLIIHENRFTYHQKGLLKILDLGEYWEGMTGLPIPLGGIAIKRNLPDELKMRVDQLLKKSIERAFQKPKETLSFVRSHAQEMDEKVMFDHINLYVNSFSLNLGENGRQAVNHLLHLAQQKKLIPPFDGQVFVNA